MVQQDGFSGCSGEALIALAAQLASWGAAAGGMGGTPSGADSSRLARRRVGASSGRPHGMGGGAPRTRSACAHPRHWWGRGTWEAGGTVWAWCGGTTATCPQGLRGPDRLETLLNAVGVGRWPAHSVWAWPEPPSPRQPRVRESKALDWKVRAVGLGRRVGPMAAGPSERVFALVRGSAWPRAWGPQAPPRPLASLRSGCLISKFSAVVQTPCSAKCK